MSSNWWMDKMWHIYSMEYYSAVKEKEIMKFAVKRMELEKWSNPDQEI